MLNVFVLGKMALNFSEIYLKERFSVIKTIGELSGKKPTINAVSYIL